MRPSWLHRPRPYRQCAAELPGGVQRSLYPVQGAAECGHLPPHLQAPVPPCCTNNIRKPETQSSVLSGTAFFLLCDGASHDIIEQTIESKEVCRMGDRVILHCDLNCFFASVELLSHPDLRDIPTAVCGDPRLPPWHHSGQERACQAAGHPDGGDHLAGQEEVSRPGAAAAPPRPVPGVLPAGQRHL